MYVYDSSNLLYRLGKPIGTGGEATVYQTDDPDLTAKIYTQARPAYEQKIEWMRENPPGNPTAMHDHESIAWPLDMLYSDKGQFVGYVMPFIRQAVPLLYVTNPRLRSKKLPSFDTRYLLRTARNLAAAVSALHDADYVIGDINESNILVSQNTLVTVIDTDSFQVQTHRSIYRCLVGKPEFTAPELQGQSFSHITRVPDHDNFGLGVLIFQLLMDGSHPFRGKWTGGGNTPPLEERIQQGLFPYLEHPKNPMKPPTNALSMDTLHPVLEDLVYRCFIDGHNAPHLRPTASTWDNALHTAEDLLEECEYGHFFYGDLSDCPYCEREDYIEMLEERETRKQQLAPKHRPVGRQPQPPQARLPRPQTVPTAPTHAPSRPTPIPVPPPSEPILSSSVAFFIIILTFGLILGIGLEYYFSFAYFPEVFGAISGLIGGLMISDTVQRKNWWEGFTGVIGALGAGYLTAQGDASLSDIVIGMSIGALVGSLVGQFIKHTDSNVLGAFLGFGGGIALGSAVNFGEDPFFMALFGGLCFAMLGGITIVRDAL